MNQHTSFFEASAFLLPFEGREHILELYLDGIPPSLLTVPRPVTSAAAFLEHLNLCSQDEYRVLASGLIEAWGMSSDENHEGLLSVLRLAGETDPERLALPAECLALDLLATNRELFESAITFDQVKKCDALELFKPAHPVTLVADLDAAMNRFRSEIAARCHEKYGSRRILLRRFATSPVFMVGFFFEKSPKTLRVLDGTETEPNLGRNELRPTQFDAVLFEPSNGILSVRSGWGRLTDPIRRAFAAAFLNDPNAYEWDGATDILNLVPLVDLHEELEDVDGGYPIISELEYTIPNDPQEARYRVNAKDMRRVIDRDNASDRVAIANINRVVVKMAMANAVRRRRVALKFPNRIEFKRGSETSMILSMLHDWGVFHAPMPPDIAA
jgi:hypothetical protein